MEPAEASVNVKQHASTSLKSTSSHKRNDQDRNGQPEPRNSGRDKAQVSRGRSRKNSGARPRPTVRASFDVLVRAIIRPPRMFYTVKDLGDARLRMGTVIFFREDFKVTNPRGMTLMCSLWTPVNIQKNIPHSRACVLYLHPNSSCRLDCVRTKLLGLAASTHVCVCGFDFSGSGLSDGEYISLGYHEKEDARVVFETLIFRGFQKILLWGRSMGAATALMFAGTYGDALRDVCAGLVLDSPFSSFEELALRLTQSGAIRLPSIATRPLLGLIRWSVRSRADFDILKVSPVAAAEHVKIPAIVLTAENDEIVHSSLSTHVYDALKGPKVQIVFQGTHNSRRPQEIFAAAKVFIEGRLCNKMPASGEPLMICVRNTACTPLTSTAPPNERQRNAAAGIATEPQEGKHEGTANRNSDQSCENHDVKESEEIDHRSIELGAPSSIVQAEGEVKHERKPATRNRRYKALFKGRPHSERRNTHAMSEEAKGRIRSLPLHVNHPVNAPEKPPTDDTPKSDAAPAQQPSARITVEADLSVAERAPPAQRRRRWFPRFRIGARKTLRDDPAVEGLQSIMASRVCANIEGQVIEELLNDAVEALICACKMCTVQSKVINRAKRAYTRESKSGAASLGAATSIYCPGDKDRVAS